MKKMEIVVLEDGREKYRSENFILGGATETNFFIISSFSDLSASGILDLTSALLKCIYEAQRPSALHVIDALERVFQLRDELKKTEKE